jgi:CheY-like chemotaxis protein
MQRGTGLSLASAYGIVRNHGGHIDVQSAINQGTAFHIFLKAHEEDKIDLPSKNVYKGDGTILLVDDDPMILEVGQVMLRALGYTVLTANGGKEAISIYSENQKRISLVILDMIMPDVGGGATFDCIKEINSEVLVLLASGYSLEGEAAEIMNRGCSGFIQKPYSMQLLSEKVNAIMEQ